MSATVAAFLYRLGLVRRLRCAACGAEHYGPTADICPRCALGVLPPAYISPKDAVELIAARRTA